jgi:hypothetical protein
MTQKEFIDMLDITAEGHYPFYAFMLTGKGKRHIVAIDISNMQAVYGTVNTYLKGGATHIHVSADFPKCEELGMPTDFVGIHTYENGEWSVVLLPYDAQGNRLPLVENGDMQQRLLVQCQERCSPMPHFSTN